ncbi:16S rRNA pseudouridine(516) synthase RsuA [Parashewanella spongiae]|uniref:Pseudouridine synthase n=1 Tax=Parashewanella spongiae TaxID=342950 RepID=A0A3A6U3E7_9GAMM|nr:16S rRNA pseudouridine(516) synthase RsuA [Parashewanella spongiae]MCL1078115.1 16S rRNA pseudouridine(516) synthase RsuA [Parashewanella spongiae]RJY16361.1 16S rRNA pseudouridine(516) synthase RsuA [Parashewanella spongiae]
MRLDKFICEATELTRNLAKKAIKSGDISCDGVIIKNAAFKVQTDMQICFEGEPIEVIGDRYIMLNKPVDTICSTTDEVYPSVISLLDVIKTDTLHIAGRLDVDTTGLVLITSDGQWSHKVASPKKECGKRYLINVAEELDNELVKQFESGICLKSEPEPLKPAKLEIIDSHTARLTITEGKYHQVKRMFAATGNKVIGLHREAVGKIELDEDLETSEWRYLTDEEVNSIK